MLDECCATYELKKLWFIQHKKEFESTVNHWTQHYPTTFLVLFALALSETFFFAGRCEHRCSSSLFIQLISIFERRICATINIIIKLSNTWLFNEIIFKTRSIEKQFLWCKLRIGLGIPWKNVCDHRVIQMRLKTVFLELLQCSARRSFFHLWASFLQNQQKTYTGADS